ncbi:MAG: hypothetical protein IIB58_09095 [Planctomycetes bacterium]|nr:hypothetical protein [Planctomycetota bacterium]
MITAENKQEFARRVILDILLSDEYIASIRRLMALENPTLDDIDRESRVAWEALVDRLLRGGGGALASGQTTVALDDSQFILYCVGSDGKRQMAVRVGVGGSDILIWPPLLSLQRR